MRLVQNTTLQGFDIPFLTSNGLINIYVKPGAKIKIPDDYKSLSLDSLLKRRMFKIIKKIVDAPVSNALNINDTNFVVDANKTVSTKTSNSK